MSGLIHTTCMFEREDGALWGAACSWSRASSRRALGDSSDAVRWFVLWRCVCVTVCMCVCVRARVCLLFVCVCVC